MLKTVKPAKIKKQRISPLLLSGLYPPPGTLPNRNLLQGGFGSSAGGECSRGVAHDGISNRAEGTYTSRVLGKRVSVRNVVGRWCAASAHDEGVAALGTARQLRINQASRSGGRQSGARAVARRGPQASGKSRRRIGRVVRNLSCVQCANRRHCGRFIGRDTCT